MLINRGKKAVVLLGIFIMVLGLLNGCTLAPKEEEKLAPPLVKPKKAEYETFKVIRKDLTKTFKANGTLVAKKEESLYYKESGGRIRDINVTLGKKVKKGTILMVLDGGDIESRIKLQEYTLDKAQIQMNTLNSQLKKLLSLYEEGQASTEEIENLKTEIKLHEIDLKGIELSLNDLKRQYTGLMLVSPIDGVVSFIEDVKGGDMVQAFKTLVIVSDTSELQLYYQSEATPDLRKVKTGTKAKIYDKTTQYEGIVVLAADSVPNDAMDKYKNAVMIKIENLPQVFSWGQFLDFSVDIETRNNVISIPRSGLRRYAGTGSSVYILEGTSKKEIPVEVGLETAYDAEIISGLKEGQTVILK